MPSPLRKAELLVPDNETLDLRVQQHVPIIKLHGSVNWFILNDTQWVASTAFRGCDASERDEPFWIDEPDVDIDAVIDKITDDAAAKGAIPKDDATIDPAIIPPMLGKSSAAPIIVNQWNAAISAISAAKQIFVIGYSFPQTDAFMPRLLTKGMENHLTFERFTIIDKQSEAEWESRLTSLFPPVFRRQRVQFYQIGGKEANNTMALRDFDKWAEWLQADQLKVRR